jgi:predicted enzyme related to lactoylglutathione lyase
VTGSLRYVEFPADDPDRARAFWSGVLGVDLAPRSGEEGQGWQTRDGASRIGLHPRAAGPGDRVSLPYFEVDDLAPALDRVAALGGSVVHAGARYAVCRDSEGSPFAIAQAG